MHNYSMQLAQFAKIGFDMSARISYLAVPSIAAHVVSFV